MSTAAIVGDLKPVGSTSQLLPERASVAPSSRSRRRSKLSIRRRPSQVQGRALEKVGHSIEYLIDSRLFITSGLDDRAEHEAVQVLMSASRAVFSECAKIVSLRHQFSRWVEQHFPWLA